MQSATRHITVPSLAWPTLPPHFPHTTSQTGRFSPHCLTNGSIFPKLSHKRLDFPHTISQTARFSPHYLTNGSIFPTLSHKRLDFPHTISQTARFSPHYLTNGSIFPTLSHKGSIFVKQKSIEHKMCFRFLWPCIVSKVWRERKNQQHATIRCLLLTSASTCFGHHYSHLQENKDPVTAFGVLRWFCWMWLVAVVGRCEHCSHPTTQRPQNRYQPHPAEPEQYNVYSSTVFDLLKMGIMMPETCWDRS